MSYSCHGIMSGGHNDIQNIENGKIGIEIKALGSA